MWKCPKCGREFNREGQDHYCGKVPKTIDEYIDANIIHFAASKKHLGLYPGGEATTVFAEELRGWDVSKGTIRLPWKNELPTELIQRIARWCYEEYTD